LPALQSSALRFATGKRRGKEEKKEKGELPSGTVGQAGKRSGFLAVCLCEVLFFRAASRHFIPDASTARPDGQAKGRRGEKRKKKRKKAYQVPPWVWGEIRQNEQAYQNENGLRLA